MLESIALLLSGLFFIALTVAQILRIRARRRVRPSGLIPAIKTLTDAEVEEFIKRWVEYVELTQTKKLCKCPWQIHPDDTEKMAGTRRMRRVDNDPWCPVHTREGFLKGFLEWAGKHD